MQKTIKTLWITRIAESSHLMVCGFTRRRTPASFAGSSGSTPPVAYPTQNHAGRRRGSVGRQPSNRFLSKLSMALLSARTPWSRM